MDSVSFLFFQCPLALAVLVKLITEVLEAKDNQSYKDHKKGGRHLNL